MDKKATRADRIVNCAWGWLLQLESQNPLFYKILQFLLIYTLLTSLLFTFLLLQFASFSKILLFAIVAPSTLLLTLLAIFFNNVRCVLTLCLSEMCGRVGQSLLLLLITSLLLHGPTTRLMDNLEKTSTSLFCIGNSLENEVAATQRLLFDIQDRVKERLLRSLEGLQEISQKYAAIVEPVMKQTGNARQAISNIGAKITEAQQQCHGVASTLASECDKILYGIRENAGKIVDGTKNGAEKVVDDIKKGVSGVIDKIPIFGRLKRSLNCPLVDGLGNICAGLTGVTFTTDGITIAIGQLQQVETLLDLKVNITRTSNGSSNVGESVDRVKVQTKSIFNQVKEKFAFILSIGQFFTLIPLILLPIFATKFLNAQRREGGSNSNIGGNGTDHVRHEWFTRYLPFRGNGTRNGGKLDVCKNCEIKEEETIMAGILKGLLIPVISSLLILGLEWAVYLSMTVGKMAVVNVTLEISGSQGLGFEAKAGSLMDLFAGALTDGFRLEGGAEYRLELDDCLPEAVEPSSWGFLVTITIIHGFVLVLILMRRWASRKRIGIVHCFYPELKTRTEGGNFKIDRKLGKNKMDVATIEVKGHIGRDGY